MKALCTTLTNVKTFTNFNLWLNAIMSNPFFLSFSPCCASIFHQNHPPFTVRKKSKHGKRQSSCKWLEWERSHFSEIAKYFSHGRIDVCLNRLHYWYHNSQCQKHDKGGSLRLISNPFKRVASVSCKCDHIFDMTNCELWYQWCNLLRQTLIYDCRIVQPH